MKKIIKISILTLLITVILNAGMKNMRNKGIKTSSNVTQSKIIAGSFQNKTIIMNGGTLQISGSDNNITVKGSKSSFWNKIIPTNVGTIQISGSNNDITVKGNALAIYVSGSDNTVNIKSVSSVTLSGSNNKIYYKYSPTRSGKPSVSSSGFDNAVSKR